MDKINTLDLIELLNGSEEEWKPQIGSIIKSNIEGLEDTERLRVYKENGHVVGFIYYIKATSKITLIELVYVIPAYRNRGIASRLIADVEEESEVVQIYYNKKLHSFYAKQGYESGENIEIAIKNIYK